MTGVEDVKIILPSELGSWSDPYQNSIMPRNGQELGKTNWG
jgi:hypothetical protein